MNGHANGQQSTKDVPMYFKHYSSLSKPLYPLTLCLNSSFHEHISHLYMKQLTFHPLVSISQRPNYDRTQASSTPRSLYMHPTFSEIIVSTHFFSKREISSTKHGLFFSLVKNWVCAWPNRCTEHHVQVCVCAHVQSKASLSNPGPTHAHYWKTSEYIHTYIHT